MIRFIRSLISNIATLILSFVLAFIIWVIAVRANDPITTKSFQLEITEQGILPEEGLITKDDRLVRITVEGPESQLSPLTAQDFIAYIDLSQATFGISDTPIFIEKNVDDPLDQIKTVFQEPQETEIEIEQIVSKQIPVVVKVQGNAARGHEPGAPVSDPPTIQITGAERQVNRIDEARINIFLDDARADVVRVRQATYYGSDSEVISIGNLDASVSQVRVTVPIAEIEGVAEKPVIVNWAGNPATGYRLLGVSVEPNSLLVTGAPTVLQELRSISTEEIDISGLNESITQRVTLDLPEGVVLDEVQPVLITVEVEPILTSDVIRARLEVRALTEGYTATLQTEEVSVFLFGPLPILESITADDVNVTLDLLELEPGSYTLEPIVSVAVSNIEFRSVQPQLINVLIEGPADEEETGEDGEATGTPDATSTTLTPAATPPASSTPSP